MSAPQPATAAVICQKLDGQSAGATEDSRRAEEYARTTYKIIVGEDTSFNATDG
jgi:hypothetical protein